MSLLTCSIFITLMTLQLKYCKPFSSWVDWETAYEHCRTQKLPLVDRKDVQNNLSYFSGLPPIWSSIKGQYTPWIAYRGCIYDSICGSKNNTNLSSTNCHTLKNNTPGNCYNECNSNNKTYGGCSYKVNFFFGLQKSLCLCMCDNIIVKHLSESIKCSFPCGTSFNDGECGGIGYFSMYEIMNITLPDTHFGGFCLTCRQQSESNKTMLYSLACNEEANGYCVMVNGLIVWSPIMSTFDSYWKYCRNNNLYIVGSTDRICHLRDSNIWTGLQKYKITNSYIDIDSCYIVKILNETVIYKKRNCTEEHFFLCKQDSSLRHDTSIENNTENTAQPPLTRGRSWTTKAFFPSESLSIRGNTTSEINITTSTPTHISGGKKAKITGAIIAGILALLFIVLLVVYLLKRRRFQCLQEKQQQTNRHHVTNNTTYDDLVVTTQRHDDNHTYATLSYDKQAKL